MPRLTDAALSVLHFALAWVAWDAQSRHPMWWHDCLKYGVAALAVIHIVLMPNKPAWIVHKVVFVSMAGALLFLKMHKADWEPIDKGVSVYLAVWGVLLLVSAIRRPAEVTP